ncbi:pollen-specific leucine-rich repeat extensin-like protein 4 [Iris pallida]|uniref:Pollen-specific leucine-rich repeat extensin-like protein 4 n=1 Tax=Iris pallida TaxID=29817 RepID=A0AAX6I4G0_IRIPA|nr:pollen-specific leucine-rich repeat extensin-like protein 4 [Iris pallida]
MTAHGGGELRHSSTARGGIEKRARGGDWSERRSESASEQRSPRARTPALGRRWTWSMAHRRVQTAEEQHSRVTRLRDGKAQQIWPRRSIVPDLGDCGDTEI